jgi:hypothetical protein
VQRFVVFLLIVGFAACADVTATGSGPAAPAAAAKTSAAFVAWEAGWLAELGATDPRLAARLPVQPSVEVRQRAAAEAVVRGGDDVGIVDGAIDVLSFGERERRLRRLRDELRLAPEPQTPEGRAEIVLLTRLVDAEDLRVTMERRSPESASEWIRAIVATWGHPASATEVDAREQEVTRALLEVLADVRPGRLSNPEAIEIEEALDPLEHLAVPEGYPEATKAITSLRVELGKAHPIGVGRVPMPALASRLAAYLGVRESEDVLRARLEEEEVALRGEAKAALGKLAERTANEVLTSAAADVHAETSCVAAPQGSLVRGVRPASERALVCEVLQLSAAPGSAAASLVATLVQHDDVAIALWALALENGASDLDVVRTQNPLISSVPHDRQDRLVRSALVSPVRSIAPGLAVTIVDAEGPDATRDRARRWIAFGDAPFDIVGAALATSKRD